MKKTLIVKPRLPKDVVEVLRHKGGFHSTPKGAKGYDRKVQKKLFRRDV